MQDDRTIVFQKIQFFLFFDFNGFWRGNNATRLTAKYKLQAMAKRLHNFEKALRDRNKREKKIGIAQML